MLQLHICYHENYYATLMLLEKLCYMKTNINLRDQEWNRAHKKSWVKDFVLPHKYHASNFYRRLRHTLVN